jgi:hypothetical protein
LFILLGIQQCILSINNLKIFTRGKQIKRYIQLTFLLNLKSIQMKLIPVCLLVSACSIFTSVKAQKTTLSTAETNALIVVHENQKLSLFVYDSLYAIWGINPFGNIRSAESQHVNFLNDVAGNYALELETNEPGNSVATFTTPQAETIYQESISKGSLSVVDALKMGARLEEMSLQVLHNAKAVTIKSDLLHTFDILAMGSKNNLQAFNRRLKMYGITYEPGFLEQKDFRNIINQ